MIKAFPLVNSLKSTLFPGEFSTRTSRLGSFSPTLMNDRAELWNERAEEESANRRSAYDAMINWKCLGGRIRV